MQDLLALLAFVSSHSMETFIDGADVVVYIPVNFADGRHVGLTAYAEAHRVRTYREARDVLGY